MSAAAANSPGMVEDHRTEIEKNYLKKRIAAAVEANFQPSTFRSSAALKKALKSIVESHVVPHLKYCYGQATFNTRMGALMKLSVSFLCMPRLSTLLGFGLIPSQNEGYEMTRRLKACVTELLSILVEVERSKLTDASDAYLDIRRIDLLVDLVLLRRSLLIPFVITMTENCPEALTHMSCHILVVSALADDILETINIVTKKVRNLLNQDLSLTTTSTREILKSEFSNYFKWLRLHQDGLIKICRNNEIFCSVDKSIKAWLKGEEYESPAQILDRYNQKYRKYLTNMNIPLQDFRIEDVRQAVKDIKRDTIMLNNIRYSPRTDAPPSSSGGLSRSRNRDNALEDSPEGGGTSSRNGDDYDCIERLINSKSNDERHLIGDDSDVANDKTLEATGHVDKMPTSTSEIRNENEIQNESELENEPKAFLVHAIVEELTRCLSKCSEGSQEDMEYLVETNKDCSFSVKHSPSKTAERVEKASDSPPDPATALLEFEKIKLDDKFEDLPSVSTFSYLEVERVSVDSFEEVSQGDLNSVHPAEDGQEVHGADMPYSPNSTNKSVSTTISASTYSPQIRYNMVNKAHDDYATIRLHENVLEMLLNHVLIAASRTTAGGDAYILLENLYGGEGLLFSPRSYKSHRKHQRDLKEQKDMRKKRADSLEYGGGYAREYAGIRDALQLHSEEDRMSVEEEAKEREKAENYSGIEISISSSGVRVVLKEHYNLLLKESLEQNMDLLMPLISFECTTTTHIVFPTTHSVSTCMFELCNNLLYNCGNICRRTVTIEPLIFK